MADASQYLGHQFTLSTDGDGDDLGFNEEDIFDSEFESVQSIRYLKENIEIDNVYGRQLAARNIVSTLRNVLTNEVEEREEIWDVLPVLAKDTEPSVRTEFVEKIPQIVLVALESRLYDEGFLKKRILPLVGHSLTDNNAQVRKASQTALVDLIEDSFLVEGDIVSYIWEIIEDLSHADSPDDFRSEAVSLMSKVGPLLNQATLEQLVLPHLVTLCSDSLFHVRKVCAANLGSICRAVGAQCSEAQLLPKFLVLCRDGVWGVRKACAESCAEVSACVSSEKRWNELTEAFTGLLSDDSRWVRMSAFQQLGPFIATFADSSKTGLVLTSDGRIERVETVVTGGTGDQPAAPAPVQQSPAQPSPSSSSDSGLVTQISTTSSTDEVFTSNKSATTPVATPQSFEDAVGSGGRSRSSSANYSVSQTKNTSSESAGAAGDTGDRVRIHLDNLEDFNSFTYWRTPLPEIDVNLEFHDGHPTAITVCTRVTDQSSRKVYTSEMAVDLERGEATTNLPDTTAPSPLRVRTSSTSMVVDSDSDSESYGSARSRCASGSPRDPPLGVWKQDVLPEVLLTAFLSMVDLEKQQTVDSEICRHCAHNFPAVAFTLGPRNWKCIRGLFDTLAQDMQWRVRRALAFSLHELAVILGRQVAANYLRRAYSELAADLDEVRVGLVQHLADFLRSLPQPLWEEMVLKKLPTLLKTENKHNWRYRVDFAEQLLKLVNLLQCGQVHKHVVPCMWQLFCDRVHEVRTVTYTVVSAVLRKFADSEEYLAPLLRGHILRQAESTRWDNRQRFAQLCGLLVTERSLDRGLFVEEMLPQLLNMVTDPVVSVRISLARTLHLILDDSEYFASTECVSRVEALENAVKTLMEDSDRDVRSLAGSCEPIPPPVMRKGSSETELVTLPTETVVSYEDDDDETTQEEFIPPV